MFLVVFTGGRRAQGTLDPVGKMAGAVFGNPDFAFTGGGKQIDLAKALHKLQKNREGSVFR